jgi:hypothetical protein
MRWLAWSLFAAVLSIPAIGGAQAAWTVAVTPTMDPLPVGFCAAIQLTVLDPAVTDVPRSPLGSRVTIADFDIAVTGNSVVANRIDATHWESCACQGATPGATATVTATYPAQSLATNARIPGVTFQRSATFTLAAPKGASNPPGCRARGYPANGPLPSPPPGTVPLPVPAVPVTPPTQPVAPPVGTALPPTAPPVAVAVPPSAPTLPVPLPGAAPTPRTESPAPAPAPTAPVPITGTTAPPRTADPAPAPGAPPVPINPAGFTAAQTAPGQVLLSWQPVSSASYYVLFGPGVTAGGEKIVGLTTFTATNVPAGNQQWALASFYDPGPISTAADAFPRVALNVIAPAAPAPAPAPGPVVPTSARYRLVATGFRVVNHTVDSVLDLDGKGDEVYGAFAMFHVKRSNGQVLDQDLRRTGVHGQIIPSFSRFVAGSATPAGGLVGGDVYPASSVSAAPGNQTFPFVVWEGTLTDAQDAVVVLPMIWEWDNDDSSYDAWFLSEQGALPVFWWDEGIQAALKTSSPRWLLTETFATNFGFAGLLPATSKDRPISMVLRPAGFELQRRVLVLTRETIESGFRAPSVPPTTTQQTMDNLLDMLNGMRRAHLALATSGVVGDVAAGGERPRLPPGEIEITLVDGPGPTLNGNYEIRLRIERLPPVSPVVN